MNTGRDANPVDTRTKFELIYDDVDKKTQKGKMIVNSDISYFEIKKGKALIISMNYYGFGDWVRQGNENDRDSMDKLLKSIGFEVLILEDKKDNNDIKHLNKQDIVDIIQEWSNDNNNHFKNDCDCLIVVIMAHGYQNRNGEEFIVTRTGNINVKWIYESFSNNKCKSLLGKPKLFFLQHCRGDKKDRGIFTFENLESSEDQKFSIDCASFQIKSIAKMSEFFIANASFEGYEAYLSKKGSWFIQEIVKVFTKRIPENVELYRMMLEVHRNISNFYIQEKELIQCGDRPIENNIVKESPCIKSTMTKNVYFKMNSLKEKTTCKVLI